MKIQVGFQAQTLMAFLFTYKFIDQVSNRNNILSVVTQLVTFEQFDKKLFVYFYKLVEFWKYLIDLSLVDFAVVHAIYIYLNKKKSILFKGSCIYIKKA